MRAIRLSRAALAAICVLACQLARADVDIEVRGVPEELRNNVLAYLSLTRYRNDELDADVIERLHNRIDGEVRAALRPFGYYEPKIKSEITRRDRDNWRTIIDIQPGEPVIMQSVDVRVSGPGKDDPLFRAITNNPPLRPGARLNHAAYEQIKADLQRTAATYGYLEARLTRNELRVDPAKRAASVFIELETGPRYRFGTTSIAQDVIDESLIRRYMRYRQDDPFDVTDLLRTQFALDDSQYFSTVEVVPGELDREEHVVPISIHAEPAKRDGISYGAGYGTDSGPRGTITWDRRRVNTRGHRFATEIRAASEIQELESRYTIPIGDPVLEKLAFTATVNQQELADIETEDISVEPSITRVRGLWQHVWFVTVTRSSTESITDSGAGDTQVQKLLVPGIRLASVPRGYLGEELFERGFFVELRGSHHSLGSDEDFIQIHVQLERVFPLNDRWHLLLRGEGAGSLVSDVSELPGSYRFFAGGDRSVRGFGFNDLSPVIRTPVLDGNNEPVLGDDGKPLVNVSKVGGRHMLSGTVELVRNLPRNLGIATFFDIGNAYDKFGEPPDPDDSDFLEYSAGFGIRWRLPVVTLGIDIAQPLSEPGAGPRLHINFSPKL